MAKSFVAKLSFSFSSSPFATFNCVSSAQNIKPAECHFQRVKCLLNLQFTLGLVTAA